MRVKFVHISVLCLWLSTCLISTTISAKSISGDHLTLVVVPELSLEDIEFLSADNESFWDEVSMTGINVKAAGPSSYINEAVTLSTGSRGTGVAEWNAYNRGEKVLSTGSLSAEGQYRKLQGTDPVSPIIHPLIHSLSDKNTLESFGSKPGLLGGLLEENGIKTNVAGTSDYEEEKVRYGSLFTMNEKGEARGQLNEGMVKVPHAPGGWKVDREALTEWLEKARQENEKSFSVIEWGEFYRFHKDKENMDPSWQRSYQQQLRKELQTFLVALRNNEQNFMVLGVTVPKELNDKGYRIAPVALWEKGQQHGLPLYSHTTRQAFISSNVDIVPTILSYFQIEVPGELTGSPLTRKKIEGEEDGREAMFAHFDWLAVIYSTRPEVLLSYIILLAFLLFSSFLYVWKKREDSSKARYLLPGVLLGGMSSPFWFLVTPVLLKSISFYWYVGLIFLLSFLTGLLLAVRSEKGVWLSSLLLFIMVSFDLLLGSPLMQRSYLGYDPLIGARYYGIGNEYAGFYVISALFIIHYCLRKKLWKSGGFLAILTLFFLGASFLGSNAGATLSAGLMFSYLFFQLLFPSAGKLKKLALTGGALIGALSFLKVMQLAGPVTHIGDAFKQLEAGNFSYILEIMIRKAEMNIKILRYSNWTTLFVTSYVVAALLLIKGKFKLWDDRDKVVIKGGAAGSIFLLLLNDSGVTAAATSMFFLICGALIWKLQKEA